MIKLGNNNIGRVYFGSNPIGKAYLGSNLVYQSGSSPTPPTPTTSVPYIRNTTREAYIDTGITPDNTTKVIVWARNFNLYSGALFGSQVAVGDSSFHLGTYNGRYTGALRTDYGNTTSYCYDRLDLQSDYHKYELYQGTLTIDDEVVGTNTGTFTGNNHNIHLVGQNRGGTHVQAAAYMDICACKIYKNGTLVRDFTATNSPSVGLYDAVSNTLFTNAGTGSFSYGTFDPNAYTRLDYIECDKQQYFDSGVYGSYADMLIVKFRPTETTAQLYDVLGFVDTVTPSSERVTVGASSVLNNRLYWIFGNNNTTVSLYNSQSPNLTNKDITLLKELDARATNIYENYTQIGTTATPDTNTSPTTFVTSGTMWVGYAPSYETTRAFRGRFYYIRMGFNRNFVPAKVNNVAGMYETYNDVFYPSTSGTNFIAGNEL